MIHPPPTSTLFPYTTLFRSVVTITTITKSGGNDLHGGFFWFNANRALTSRSEEHTSELQSRVDLVCRLLLEKKKHRRLGAHEALRTGDLRDRAVARRKLPRV